MRLMQAIFVMIVCLPGWGEVSMISGQSDMDLTLLSLEELMSVEVTTVTKKPQKLNDVSAAVSVFSNEEIVDSGFRNVADLLRMAPGMEVASIDANKWAISARGFSDRFANKLLVLMDGRSVYTSPFSGVYWDAQDFILEDIERIEIIHGPGASLWGANAMNGVINILTKPADHTQGGLLSLTAGNGYSEGYGRYGFKTGSQGYGRFYVKGLKQDSRFMVSGEQGGDAWQSAQTGLRWDKSVDKRNRVTLQGDFYQGQRGRTILDVMPETYQLVLQRINGNVYGGNFMIRWQENRTANSEMIIQTYIDFADRNSEELAQKYITGNVDFQYRFKANDHHELMWGTEYQYTVDWLNGTHYTLIEPSHRNLHFLSGFFQDEMAFFKKSLLMTIGTKFEYNSITGFEIQPSIRGIWMGREKHRYWAAISRAVRTPSRIERDGNVLAAYSPAGELEIQHDFPLFGRVVGQSSFQSETLYSNEIGYRYQPSMKFSVDLTAFYNIYDRLRIAGIGETRLMGTHELPYIEQYLMINNDMSGHSKGFESTIEWQLHPDINIRLIYSYIKLDFTYDANYAIEGKVLSDYTDEKSPDHQAALGCGWRIFPRVNFFLLGRYQTPNPAIQDQLNMHLNMRLAWQINQQWSVSASGQNLLEHDKLEYVSTFPGILIHNAISTRLNRVLFMQLKYQW